MWTLHCSLVKHRVVEDNQEKIVCCWLQIMFFQLKTSNISMKLMVIHIHQVGVLKYSSA